MTEKINAYFEKEKANLLSDLEKLIKIPSVRGEASEDMPFGAEPKKALDKMLEIASDYGFITNNIDNYAGEINLNDKETKLAILGHLDVVPEGDGWSVPPYEMTVKDGKVYGRGTSDDKGPVICALYALKAIKDLGIDLSYNARLIAGTSEETGSEDIGYYVTKRQMPPMTFTPDSSFPVTNVEKGRFSKAFTGKVSATGEKSIVSFDSGLVVNAVPGKAKVEVKGFSFTDLEKLTEEAKKETGVEFTLNQNGEITEILAEGVSAHASLPENGNNALTALVKLLSALESDCATVEAFRTIAKLFPHGKLYGEGLGVDMEDEVSGKLTLSLDILRFDGESIYAEFDTRVPLCATKENLAFKVRYVLSANGFVLSDTEMVAVHYVDENSDFIKKLLSAYEAFSGSKGYCEAIGGGTYVHNIEGGVAFGAVMPGVDTNMHGIDEFMPIDDLITAAKIFTLAVIEICK